MKKPIVVLTDVLDEEVMPSLEEVGVVVLSGLAPEIRASHLRRAHVLVVRSGAPLPPDILDDTPNLLGVVRHGTGVDVIPMEAANRLAIPVANTPGCNSISVAEYGIIVMGMLSRKLHIADATLRHDGWAAAKQSVVGSRDLSGKVVGIVGLGEVGRRIASICNYGFAMKVIGHTPRADSVPSFVEAASLTELLAQSDFVVLACPLTDNTRRMISAVQFQRMKRTAHLINLARGELVDTDALLTALDRREIAGAALDVYEREPIPPDHPLIACERLLLTPHTAARTKESDVRMGVATVRQVFQFLKGERPQHLVNPSAWDSSTLRRASILSELAALTSCQG